MLHNEQEIRIPTTREFREMKDRLEAIEIKLSDLSAGAIKARIYKNAVPTPTPPQ